MKKQKSERLSVLSELEEFAFYGFPDFDPEQRSTYFEFNQQEWDLISKCSSLHIQVGFNSTNDRKSSRDDFLSLKARCL